MTRHCLVFLNAPLVAHDLAMTMQDLTGCAPILAHDPKAAENAVRELGEGADIAYAFVHLGAAEYGESPLRQLLDQRDARVVLLGRAAEEGMRVSAWPVLVQPFSTGQVADLLAQLDAVPAAAQPEADLHHHP